MSRARASSDTDELGTAQLGWATLPVQSHSEEEFSVCLCWAHRESEVRAEEAFWASRGEFWASRGEY